MTRSCPVLYETNDLMTSPKESMVGSRNGGGGGE